MNITKEDEAAGIATIKKGVLNTNEKFKNSIEVVSKNRVCEFYGDLLQQKSNSIV